MDSKKSKAEIKSSSSSSFFPTSPKSLDSSKIRRHVLQRFGKKEYLKLKQEMTKYGLTGARIADFFSKEGSRLLIFSLVSGEDGPLKFLMEEVPKTSLQEVLKQDNFSVLQTYLRGLNELEASGWYSEKAKENQTSKFKALLSIDDEAVRNFMASGSVGDDPLSDKIKDNFKDACHQFAEANLSASKSSS